MTGHIFHFFLKRSSNIIFFSADQTSCFLHVHAWHVRPCHAHPRSSRQCCGYPTLRTPTLRMATLRISPRHAYPCQARPQSMYARNVHISFCERISGDTPTATLIPNQFIVDKQQQAICLSNKKVGILLKLCALLPRPGQEPRPV
jgi:hypothetical protein